MPPPSRPSGTTPFPPSRSTTTTHSIPVYEVIKTRILVKLQDRFDASKSRRMPASLLHESTRQQIEQVVEAEAHRLTRTERDRLTEEVHAEMFGFGPLEELFADPEVREVVVLGPHAVIARRDQGWLPTNVKFRDDEHLLEVLAKARSRGEAVGGALPTSVLDVKLANGFRAVAVIPPTALAQPPTAAFIRRTETSPRAPVPPTPAADAGPRLVAPPGGPGTHAPPRAVGSGGHPAVSPQGGTAESERAATPHPRAGAHRSPVPGEDFLERHRVRITERLIAKLSNLGVYDLSRLDIAELRKVVAAFVAEYCRAEKIYLSDTDQGRLTLEILTGMNR
jgi:hypothetical protein